MTNNLNLDRAAMKDKATAHLRVYVGNLTERATIEDLYDHFISYGPISGIVVNRNFGFVQYENEDDAQKAINNAGGSNFQGKTINVRTAQTGIVKPRSTDTMISAPEGPHDQAPSDKNPVDDDNNDEQYDGFGNYVADQGYREDDRLGHGRGRGASRGQSRGARARPAPYPERGPPGRGAWSERPGYDRYPAPAIPEYPRALPVPEKNDCEIIVVAKSLTEYAEYIEGRLKRLGVVVDLLFPMEDVPIGKVLGNIASRGCLYAIMVMPENQEHRSLTLTMLHGLPQEHRDMPIEDALQLISRNYQEIKRGGTTGREAVFALLGQLADGRSLTVMQYDKVIEYLQERKEKQAKIELGEPLTNASKTQTELQQRILNILNNKNTLLKENPAPQPVQAPTPGPQPKLLNDPNVRKALDSILQKFV